VRAGESVPTWRSKNLEMNASMEEEIREERATDRLDVTRHIRAAFTRDHASVVPALGARVAHLTDAYNLCLPAQAASESSPANDIASRQRTVRHPMMSQDFGYSSLVAKLQ
jgi:hypothetical protein